MQLSEQATFDVLDRVALQKLVKASEVVGRKCAHYGVLAKDDRTKAFFENQEKTLEKTVNDLHQMISKLT